MKDQGPRLSIGDKVANKSPKAKLHYVDNKKFYTALLHHKKLVEAAKANKTQEPRVSDYVGECLYKIAVRLSLKPNFINYTYRDEMISDGLENCINYLNNFDPEKYDNPFAYFTQIIWYAFLRRIEKEKKHLYIKQKTLENFYFEGLLADQAIDDDNGKPVTVDLDNAYMNNLVEAFEEKQETKQLKAKAKRNAIIGVEKFYEGE